jgi:hypothetical protein
MYRKGKVTVLVAVSEPRDAQLDKNAVDRQCFFVAFFINKHKLALKLVFLWTSGNTPLACCYNIRLLKILFR